ncbi:TetR/AcrR family transcriptional regulator [Nocardia sp. NPDC051832]|uniref:TetR/AcrR family transcriptional regulator n=1 Tax=Nocardia sp. NPDC051832 TaxID=3155673 RepID=UPI003445ECCF
MTDTAAPSTRQDRRKARTRGRILDAAEELFVESGDSATIEQIAATADVAVATIYQHFTGKDALQHAIVERAIEANERHLMAIYDATGDPVERLVDAAGAYTRFYLESPRLFAMTQSHQGEATGAAEDPAATMAADRIRALTDRLAGVFDEAVRQGRIRKAPGRDLAHALWGLLNGIIGLAARTDSLRLSETDLRAALIQGLEMSLEGLVTATYRDRTGRLNRKLRQRIRSAFDGAHADVRT